MIQREHVTLVVAITGAILAAVSLSWTIFRDVYKRGRLKVYATFVPERRGGRPVSLAVKVANDGSEPVVVEGIFSKLGYSHSESSAEAEAFAEHEARSESEHLVHWRMPDGFPRRLEAKETFTVVTEGLELVGPFTESVFVMDSSGKSWPLSEGQMSDLRATWRAFLQD